MHTYLFIMGNLESQIQLQCIFPKQEEARVHKNKVMQGEHANKIKCNSAGILQILNEFWPKRITKVADPDHATFSTLQLGHQQLKGGFRRTTCFGFDINYSQNLLMYTTLMLDSCPVLDYVLLNLSTCHYGVTLLYVTSQWKHMSNQGLSIHATLNWTALCHLVQPDSGGLVQVHAMVLLFWFNLSVRPMCRCRAHRDCCCNCEFILVTHPQTDGSHTPTAAFPFTSSCVPPCSAQTLRVWAERQKRRDMGVVWASDYTHVSPLLPESSWNSSLDCRHTLLHWVNSRLTLIGVSVNDMVIAFSADRCKTKSAVGKRCRQTVK